MVWTKQKMPKEHARKKYDQTLLALLICIPCLTITTLSLYIANVSLYLIAFIVIVLSLLCSFVVVIAKHNAQQQIRTLANILESMIEGDYTLRGRLQNNQAFQELLTLVNTLADSLSRHKTEAKESRLLLEKIMEQMDAMVLATNEQGLIVMANASAKKLLLNSTPNFQKIRLAELELGCIITQATQDVIEFNNPQLSGEHFLFKETFLSEGKRHQLYLITNAERLLLEKERKAWQSLLRVLGHELNNSLTPIISISQAIKQKLQNESKALNRTSLCDGISIINERADSLSVFIASYSQLTHLPAPNKSTFSLHSLVSKTAKLFEQCALQVTPTSMLLDEVCVSADKSQIEQVLINLFKNAFEAMEHKSEKTIEVSYKNDDKYWHLSIKDHGMGIANKSNIFVPFYSTKKQGSGIGLTLCKQIMFNHKGSIKLNNRNDTTGAEAIISLPIMETSTKLVNS